MRYSWHVALFVAFVASVGCNTWVQHTRTAQGLTDFTPAKERTVQSLPALVNRSFWEVRRSLAILTWVEAQTYFHRGFDITAFGPNPRGAHDDSPPGSDSDHEEHSGSEHDHDDGHSPAQDHSQEGHFHTQEELAQIHSLQNHPFLRRSPLRPYVFAHDNEGGTERMMPFYWLTTALNPNFVRAYANGAYWLAFHFKKPEEALRYLEEGMRNNPGDSSLYAMRGRVYFSVLEDYDNATADFERAYALNALQDEEQCDEALWVLRYLGRTYLRLNDYDGAIRAAYRGKKVDAHAFGFDSIISEATTALEGHPS